jgi:hypothetical protein
LGRDATFRSVGGDREWLKASYGWLSAQQLSPALAYYEAYPEEIDARLEQEEHCTPEKLYAEFLILKPRGVPSSDQLGM